MVFLWFSYGFPMFSYGFPMVNHHSCWEKHTLWPGSAGSPVQSAASPADAVKLRPGDATPAAEF